MIKFKENIIASLIGVFFAFIVVFAINNYQYLKTDLINSYANTSNIDFIVKKGKIISNKDISGLQIVFLKINGNVDKTNINSNYDYLIEEINGYTNIMMLVKSLKKGDVLLNHKGRELKIEDIKLIFTDGKIDENILFIE